MKGMFRFTPGILYCILILIALVAIASAETTLDPNLLDTFTLTGTNFFPSLLNPLLPSAPFFPPSTMPPPSLFLLGIVLLLFWGFSQKLKKLPILMLWIMFALGIIFLGLGVLMAIMGWLGYAGVVVTSVPLPHQDSSAAQELVVAADGSLGELIREKNKLEVKNISRAGKYEGKIDLLPNVEDKGVVKVTVNIADWWLYAFLTTALGVIIGYGIVQYYKQQHAADKLKVRSARLWLKVVEAESRFQQKNSGRPQAGYSMTDLSKKWSAYANEKLDEDNIQAAEDRLNRLETYADNFECLQGELGTLDNLQSQLWEQVQKGPFKLSRNKIDAFLEADKVLKGELFDFSIEDAEGIVLKDCEKKVVEITEWIRQLSITHFVIEDHLKNAESLNTEKWTEDRKKNLKDQIIILNNLGNQVLMAGNKEEVKKLENSADETYSKILNLQKEAREAKAPLERARKFLLVRPYAYASTLLTAFPEIFPKAPYVSEIKCQVLGPDVSTPADCIKIYGDPDDLFIFTTDITFFDLPDPLYKVHWDFGDGLTTEPCVVTDGKVQLNTSHHFTKSGRYKVVLKDSTGVELQKLEVNVNPGPGRLNQLLTSFRLTEKQMTVITGLLAIASGFSVLYFGNASWGAPTDYLTAFLWGSVGSEGLKHVGNLVSRVWGS